MNKKIKVIQFIHGLSIGGAETLVKNYCLFFDKDKIDLVLICLMNHQSRYDMELKDAGIRVIYIYDIIDKNILAPLIVKKVFHRLLSPILIRYFMRQEKPDIIHSHVLLNRQLKFAAPETVQIYHTVHSDFNNTWNESSYAQKDLLAARWLVKNRGMRLVVLHNEMKKQVKKFFEIDNSIIINNGVDFSRFKILESKEKLRNQYNISNDDFIVGHVGRFTTIKNHFFLLEIFHKILKSKKSAKLWLIGTGVLEDEIKRKAEELGIYDSLIFWGLRSDIPEMLKMIDIIIMPSYREGLSLTLVEAQVAGTPTLVSDTIVRETSISNLMHFYSLQHQSMKWAKNAIRICEEKAKPIYKDLYSWSISKVVKQLENIYVNDLNVLTENGEKKL